MYKTRWNNGINYQPQLVSRISSINSSMPVRTPFLRYRETSELETFLPQVFQAKLDTRELQELFDAVEVNVSGKTQMSHEKNGLTFHYTGCCIGITTMVYYNPRTTG